MMTARAIKIAIAAAAFAASPVAVSVVVAAEVDAPAVVELAAGSFRYWPAGEFTRDGKPANAPQRVATIDKPLAIMRRPVSAADYRRCVEEMACPATPGAAARADMPAVMVSWRDAQAYAAWLTRRLGVRYRLPTDEEWTYAAGSRAPDEQPLARDANDPAKNWLLRYERESGLDPVAKEPRPIGSFGANEHGLVDMAGNVWEWTSSCYNRVALDAAGEPTGARTENCGVRVVEGPHRAYVSDFIRDARGGGCAAGTPPSNLGFRLVRDERKWWLF